MLRGVLAVCLSVLLACTKNEAPVSEPQTLDFRIAAEPLLFQPVEQSDANSKKIYSFIFDSLVQFDSLESGPQPGLASSWSHSKDGLRYDFQLRKDVLWHDGKNFQAEDVKASFEYWKQPNSPMADALRDLDSIEVVDPHHVRFHLKRVYFRHFYILGGAWILRKSDPSAAALVGTGPYRFKDWLRSSFIELSKNESYWGRQERFDSVKFHIIKDDQVAYMALEKGIIDAMEASAHTLQKPSSNTQVSTFQYFTEDGSGFSYIGWNLKHPHLSDLRIRRALTHAFPWQQTQRKIFSEFRPRAMSYFHPSRQIKVEAPKYDLEKSKDILKKAGFAKPLQFELLIPSSSPDAERLALIYQRELEKIGVKMNLRSLEWASFLQKIGEGGFDAYLSGWVHAWESDPYHFFHSRGASNFFSYQNSRVDKILDQARTELKPEIRRKLYEEFSQIIWEELPVLFLFQRAQAFHIKTDSVRLSEGSAINRWQPTP